MIGAPTPEEFKGKITMSWGMLVFLGFCLVAITLALSGIFHSLAEVGGVRSDMAREDQHLKDQIESVNKRIDRKIDNHNKDKDAHK